jgi:hypothetical protein
MSHGKALPRPIIFIFLKIFWAPQESCHLSASFPAIAFAAAKY